MISVKCQMCHQGRVQYSRLLPDLRVWKGTVFMVRKIRGDDTVNVHYVTGTSVGEGGNNTNRPDNLLVQLFLRHFYGKNPTLFDRLPKPRTDPEANVILLDGDIGRQAKAWIRVFQEFVRDKIGRKEGIIDGRVSENSDRVSGPWNEKLFHH